jgi:hypothetical protein
MTYAPNMDNMDTLTETILSYRFDFCTDEKKRSSGRAIAGR